MAIESHPHPDNIPKRPRMTAEVLRNLYASDTIANNPTPAAYSANRWLADMQKWTAWSSEYCKRLDAVYVEHQAMGHDHRVEPGDLADTWAQPYAAVNCKVCAYLVDQHATNQL